MDALAAPETDEEPRARVALLLVSHSWDLAFGVVELAAQLAPHVVLVAAGGLPDGGLGTSYDRIVEALALAAAAGRSVVVFTDLGSAVLTTESILDVADGALAARVRLADAPFVEGVVAAAVAADTGGDLATVLDAARLVGAGFARASAPAGPPKPSAPGIRDTAVLRNPLGLHARPAAQLARTAAGFEATVTVGGVDASSVLALIGLGVLGGTTVTVTATGPQARAALTAVVDEIEAGFGEA